MQVMLGYLSAALLTLGLPGQASAQSRPTPPSSVLLHQLRKLQDVSSALYVAAHPDDENTRLISYLANGELAETAYLSLTRGDGGQNLVGADLREGLGVIRTQELLAARRTDGGTQFFTRANDFGYSKHPDETLKFWNRDSILCDMVWVIRKWQPDVIVTRFDPNSAGETHGHHTTSAMLAVDAFDLAADSGAYPEQFAHGVEPWRAKRILFNTSWWFYGSEEAFEAADKSDLFTVDAGAYYPLLGLSNGEIAARSRSQHASQGFGSSASRGSEPEYLKLLAGDNADDRGRLFADVDDSWARVAGGAELGGVLAEAERDFDAAHPEASVPALLRAEKLMRALPANRYTRSKLPALRELIADCLGVYAEAVATDSLAVPGSEIEVDYEVIRRAGTGAVSLLGLRIGGQPTDTAVDLSANQDVTGTARVLVGETTSNPYWLEGEASLGMYAAPGYGLRGLGENPAPLQAEFTLGVGADSVRVTVPVNYKVTYPDRGELYRPLLVVPAVGLHFPEPVYLWPADSAREVTVRATSFAGAREGEVSLEVPAGWRVSPASQPLSLGEAGAQAEVTFGVTPSSTPSVGALRARLTTADQVFDRDVQVLRYPHIPQQAIIGAASAKAVRLDLKRTGERIGYVMGAGDDVPRALREIGYRVDMLGELDLAGGDLAKYDAIVLGIRAYNTQDWLPRVNDALLDYVREGGKVVVQYNTNRDVDMASLAPYPLELSRDRVTVEEAPMEFVDPDEAVLTAPNELTAADFEGWVQERGSTSRAAGTTPTGRCS